MYPKLDVHNGFNRYGSLFCFYDDCHMTQGYRLPVTPHFKRLRVLDLGSLHFINSTIPSYVADLILLRYLALRPSKSLNSLPVLKDWNLQTLVLLENRGGSTSADDPNPLIHEIWELPKLRHLQVCTTFVLGTPTAVHQYLQTVQWLRPFQCTEQVFLRIPNAKVMGIFMEGRVEFGEPNCLDNLRYLHQLEELKIESRHFYPFLLPVVDAFPVQLKKLKLKGTLVPWDAMTVIGMLPNLQVLKLKNGACQGPHWELTEGSFRQLKSLLICGSGLRHWEATGDNDFPVLQHLILKECYELEAIPSSFGEILTLKLIELCHCYSRLVNSARQIQEEQRDYGNDELVVRAYNIWEGILYVASRYSSVRTTQRWLSFESMYPKLDVHTGFERYGSLFCFHDDGYMTPQVYQLPAAPHFKRLRVLDLGSLHFITGIPSYVADLILLRYLALRPSKSHSSLPVLKDWNLQTLVLLENWGVRLTIVLGTPTVVHQCIQTVQWLRPFQCTEQVFLRIPNAKVMGIFMEGSVEFGEANLDNLRCLNQLEELKIESKHNPVLLPVVDAFPVHLKKLKLKGTLLPWDAMTVIGLRHWEATGDNDFPVLECLILKECYELEEIPSSFGEILTLKLIELCHCYSGLVNSAKQIQEEQRDYGNDELVVRAYNIWRNVEEELEDEVTKELEGSKDSEGDC
nr:putative late blight resistance protein homolog R1B-13 isoform X2 [Ipomoea trifida]